MSFMTQVSNGNEIFATKVTYCIVFGHTYTLTRVFTFMTNIHQLIIQSYIIEKKHKKHKRKIRKTKTRNNFNYVQQHKINQLSSFTTNYIQECVIK